MESGILQNLLRETVIWALASQLQPHLGHPHRCLLVLHLLQLSQDLRWHPLYTPEVVSNRSWRCGSHYNYDCRHYRRVFLYTYHLEQHLTPHPPPTLPLNHTRPHSRSDLLHRNSGKPDAEPNGTPHPRNCSVLHLRGRNPYLCRYAIWSDVRRSCCRQVKEVSRQPNFHGQLPLHDNETAVILRFSLVPCLRLQVHRILLVLDTLLPRIHRCHGRHEGSRL